MTSSTGIPASPGVELQIPKPKKVAAMFVLLRSLIAAVLAAPFMLVIAVLSRYA